MNTKKDDVLYLRDKDVIVTKANFREKDIHHSIKIESKETESPGREGPNEFYNEIYGWISF